MSRYGLPEGLYESPITQTLAEKLEAIQPEGKEVETLDTDSAPFILGHLLTERFVHALAALSGEDKLAKQIEMTNQVLCLLEQLSPLGGASPKDQVVAAGQQLKAILVCKEGPGSPQAPVRPSIGLDTSDLLVNGPHDLSVGPEIQREIASADRVDLLCSFLKWSGVRLVEKPLRELVKRKGAGSLRVLTTVYMRATSKKAIEVLRSLGAEVRVSYDVDNTRLHAKAWLFHRESGFSTGYVGSSNLSGAAMLDGLEWNVRLSQIDNKAILRKVQSTFEQYWGDRTLFRDYDAYEFQTTMQALKTEENPVLPHLDIQPRPYQQEMLDALEALSLIHI